METIIFFNIWVTKNAENYIYLNFSPVEIQLFDFISSRIFKYFNAGSCSLISLYCLSDFIAILWSNYLNYDQNWGNCRWSISLEQWRKACDTFLWRVTFGCLSLQVFECLKQTYICCLHSLYVCRHLNFSVCSCSCLQANCEKWTYIIT